MATKIGFYPEDFDFSYRAIVLSVEDSLARLGLSVLPLVQVHELSPATWEPVFARAGALAALCALQAQGLVEHVGVTGSHLPTLVAAVETGEFETVLLWRHYHLLDASGARVIAMAAECDTGVIVGTPFAGGVLASGDVPAAHYFYQPAGRRSATARERCRSHARGTACRWQQPRCTSACAHRASPP